MKIDNECQAVSPAPVYLFVAEPSISEAAGILSLVGGEIRNLMDA
jgi:hypothetical protein